MTGFRVRRWNTWGSFPTPRTARPTARLSTGPERLELRSLLSAAGWELPICPETAFVASAQTPAEGNSGNWNAGFSTAEVTGGVGNLPTLVYDPASDPRWVDTQMGLPMLDSNPGAPATIYLDFNGNFERDWWNFDDDHHAHHFLNVSTPVWDTDGDRAHYGSGEQSLIREIWARVAEDYAPWNVNVSTDYYGGFANQQAVHVVIGGNNTDWLNANASGISSIGSFHDDAPNAVFVFDLAAWARQGVSDGEGHLLNAAAAIATTASHEAGHSFGLRHHSLYDVAGHLMQTYNPGTQGWTPIMGNNLAADRTTWDADTTDQGAGSFQNDFDVLSSAANGFGYRTDDHGNSTAASDPLNTGLSVLQPLTGSGIIGRNNDSDAFRFTGTAGSVEIHVRAAANGPNLIPVAELWSSSGLVSRATGGSLTESIINAKIGIGTYYVLVRGFGDLGGVGQYTVSVSLPQGYTKAASTVVASQIGQTPSSGTSGSTVPTSRVSSAAEQGFGAAPQLLGPGLATPASGSHGHGPRKPTEGWQQAVDRLMAVEHAAGGPTTGQEAYDLAQLDWNWLADRQTRLAGRRGAMPNA